MNATASFDQVQTTYLHTARNSSSSRDDHELVVFLEKYYSLFLLVFGTVGNLLCLAVLSRETFRRSSAGIYLRFLTLSDLGAIYTGVLFFTARALFHNNFRKTDELSCKFHRWLSFTACDLSSWALVLVSTARLLSIAWPMKRLITRRRVYASILVTIIVLLGANLPIFIIYGDVGDPVRNKTSLCVFTQDSYEDFYIYVFSWLVLVKFGFLPGVLLIVLNAALVLSVSRSGRAVQQPRAHKSHPVTSSRLAARDPKTKISIRKRKLETEYSSNNTPDFESSEVSTGSEFSDRTLSTSDGSEVNDTDKADSSLSCAWNKMLVRLKLTGSHQILDYRLQESSLRKLFSGIQMLWQRDAPESEKDLVSLDEDVSDCSLRKDSTVDEKGADVTCTEIHLSWLDNGLKSGTDNVYDQTRTKTPATEHVLTENTTNMANGPAVRRTWHGLNNWSGSDVNPPGRAANATGGNTSLRVARELPTEGVQTVSDSRDPSSSCHPCHKHSNSHVEKIQLQHEVNTTTQQATTNTHTTLSSNNVWTLSGHQEYVSHILQTQTGQPVPDNCLGTVADVALLPLPELLISHDVKTRTGAGEQVNREDNATSSGDINHLKQANKASLRDVNAHNVSTKNRENRSTNHNKDIDVNVNNEIPSGGACVGVGHRSSDSCVHVDHTQRHAHPTYHDQLVCAYSMSETPSNPRGTGGSQGNSPASCRCGSCSGTAASGSCPGTAVVCAKGTESTISSGLGERTNSESATASACTSQNDTSNAEPHNTVTQVDQSIEQSVVSQKDTTNAEPHNTVTQVDQSTEQSVVSQKDTTNVCRRRSGLPRKVANKSRSLTRTLLVLNTVFLLCNTPITVYLTGKTYFWPGEEYSDVQEITVTVANFSMYTSNSINFILYCVTGSRFRGQLVLMFKELYHFVCSCARRLSRVNKQRV